MKKRRLVRQRRIKIRVQKNLPFWLRIWVQFPEPTGWLPLSETAIPEIQCLLLASMVVRHTLSILTYR